MAGVGVVAETLSRDAEADQDDIFQLWGLPWMMTAPSLWTIVRSKSLRLILANITERILFDRSNGVDTITQLAKDSYPRDISNLTHGLHYSSSWTSEIRFGFRIARAVLGGSFERYAFIDIGCGKGKVQIVWEKLLRRRGLTQQVYGIDYHNDLIDHAKGNHRKVFERDGNFIEADASSFDYGSISTSLIVYMYNPFDEMILSKVVDALQVCDVVLIYNNPVHSVVVLRSGFQVVSMKPGFHPQAETIVYHRPRCRPA